MNPQFPLLDNVVLGFWVVLPFPDKNLSPNARNAWWERQPFKKVAIQEADLRTRNQIQLHGCHEGILAVPTPPLHRAMVFIPPDNRKRDEDNLVAMMKAYLDGMFYALGIDDSNVKSSSNLFLPQSKQYEPCVIVGLQEQPVWLSLFNNALTVVLSIH